MQFNSIDFAIFLPLVFALYWIIPKKNTRWQNCLIIVASYIFYGWWDWRFLILIFASSIVDYFAGIRLAREVQHKKRKYILALSLLVNLGALSFFKYYNFFIENFIDAFRLFGSSIEASSISIILPVGISFYTLQTLGYTIDVYRNKINPTEDFTAFAAFVSFFPQLVAGPIERANNLLPQFSNERNFDYKKAMDGSKQILWGLFKKIVIADNCATYANLIFENPNDYNGSTLVLGAFFFAFQIYGDFSGYSDIAIGTAKLFGFDLRRNFAFPYFSRDVAEFWRRWHISLSSWLRDYVYIPLGGSKGNRITKIRNVMVIFVISGLWHGANWTFIIWGALNAIFFLPLLLFGQNRNHLGTVADERSFIKFKEIIQIASTFTLISFSWIFFRATDLNHAVEYIDGIFSSTLFSVPNFPFGYKMLLIILLVLVEWYGRKSSYGLDGIVYKSPKPIRAFVYYSLVLVIYFFGNFSDNIEFIYFQF